MNGNGYDLYGDEYSGIVSEPYAYSTPPIIPSSTSSGNFLDTLKGVWDRFNTRPTSPADAQGGEIYQAIYAFGAGKLDSARERLAAAFLASGTGQSIAQEVEKKRIQEMLPMILLIAVAVFGLAFFLGRR